MILLVLIEYLITYYYSKTSSTQCSEKNRTIIIIILYLYNILNNKIKNNIHVKRSIEIDHYTKPEKQQIYDLETLKF